MRIGVIGVGVAGSSHLFDLVSDDRFEVVAVCARRPERAAEAADTFGVPASYTEAEEMLNREALDGLVIATPPAAAPPILDDALTRRIPTLVDKPAADESATLRRLIANHADHAGLTVVGYNRRYQAHVHQIRHRLSDTPQDSVGSIECRWSAPFTERYAHGQTYRQNAAFGHGVLLDTACHIIDTLAFLGYDDLAVEHTALVAGPASKADVAAEIRLVGRQRQIPIAITIDDEGSDDDWAITLNGPAGHLEMTRTGARGTWLHEDIDLPEHQLARPVEDLLALGEGRRPHGASLTEAAGVLDVIGQARRPASTRRTWIRPRAKALGRLNGSC